MEYEKHLFQLAHSTLSHSQNYVPLLVSSDGTAQYADTTKSLPFSSDISPPLQSVVTAASSAEITTGSTVHSGERVYLLMERIHQIRERWERFKTWEDRHTLRLSEWSDEGERGEVTQENQIKKEENENEKVERGPNVERERERETEEAEGEGGVAMISESNMDIQRIRMREYDLLQQIGRGRNGEGIAMERSEMKRRKREKRKVSLKESEEVILVSAHS